jgi:hypothetical protein
VEARFPWSPGGQPARRPGLGARTGPPRPLHDLEREFLDTSTRADQHRARLGRHRARLGRGRARLGRHRARLGRHRARLGRGRARLGRHRARLDARRIRRTRLLAATPAVFLVESLAATGLAVSYAVKANQQQINQQQIKASRQQVLAVSRQLAAQSETLASSDPDPALLLAPQAWRFHPTPEARRGALNLPFPDSSPNATP